MKVATAYWWRGGGGLGHVANFGDQLSPFILEHFTGLQIEWAPPEEAEIVCIGSVIDSLPRRGWNGIVAGAGQLRSDTETDLTEALVLGIRGHYTRSRVRTLHTPIIADPGLLACDLVSRPQHPRTKTGVMPHWSDSALWGRVDDVDNPTFINPLDDPLSVLAQIADCDTLVSSSLHGIIVADALGIPRRAERFPSMITIAEGGDFKWDDYGSSLGQPVIFGEWQTAPEPRVRQMQHDLFEMFQEVKERF